MRRSLAVSRSKDLVAFACGVFERYPINDFDSSPPVVPDDTRRLEPGDSRRYGRPPNPEHLSQELLRQRNDVGIGVVLREQQPPAQTLLGTVEGIACRRLLDLDDDRLRTAQYDGRQTIAVPDGAAKA
jgi:hypothetical protein